MTTFDQHGNLHGSSGRFAMQHKTPADVSLDAAVTHLSGDDADLVCAGADTLELSSAPDGWKARASFEFLGDVQLADGSTVTPHTDVRLSHPDLETARRTFEGD